MGTVAYLFGVVIVMYPNDHTPPHVHAFYGEYVARFAIMDGSVLSGSIPSSKRKDVQKFISCYKDELLRFWNEHTYEVLERK